MLTIARALSLATLLACASTFVSTLEVLCRPAYIKDTHLLSWPASRLRYNFLSNGAFARIIDLLLREKAFGYVLCFRLAVAALAPFTEGKIRGGLLLALIVCYALWSLRSPYGQDGSDQMGMVIILSVALSDLVGTPSASVLACRFIASQLALSYLVAGTAKAASPIWRSGQALPLVLRTSIYGHRVAHSVLIAYPSLAFVGCWTIFVLEILFPIGLVTPREVALLLTAAMAAFHVGASFFMGLNTFMISFLAAYPCWIAVASPA